MKESDLERKIMKQIREDKVKMKPRWWFWLKVTGLRGTLLLGMLLSALILSITIYIVSIKTPIELWSYGDIGAEIFFNDFPYVWLFGGIVLVISSGVLLSKIGENYKKTTKKILTITILLVIITTALLSAIRIYLGLENYLNLIQLGL